MLDYHKSATEEVAERLTPPSIGTQNTCWNCGRKANETCSGCNLARYCGSFCQHKDWEQHHQVSVTFYCADFSAFSFANRFFYNNVLVLFLLFFVWLGMRNISSH